MSKEYWVESQEEDKVQTLIDEGLTEEEAIKIVKEDDIYASSDWNGKL